MTITGSLQTSMSLGGLLVSGSVSAAEENCLSIDTTLTAAKAGTLSTRTSDTAGTLTLSADHGITDGDIIDIYWSTGQCYGATVGTVAGTSVPFTGAAGDVLPAQTTAITAGPVSKLTAQFDFDDVAMMGLVFSTKGNITFHKSNDTIITFGGANNIETVAGQPVTWASGTGVAQPATGDPCDYINVSGGTTTAATFKMAVLYNGVE